MYWGVANGVWDSFYLPVCRRRASFCFSCEVYQSFLYGEFGYGEFAIIIGEHDALTYFLFEGDGMVASSGGASDGVGDECARVAVSQVMLLGFSTVAFDHCEAMAARSFVDDIFGKDSRTYDFHISAPQ